MKLFSLNHRQRKSISKNNVVVYSYFHGGYNEKVKNKIPASSKVELWFRKHFLDTY